MIFTPTVATTCPVCKIALVLNQSRVTWMDFGQTRKVVHVACSHYGDAIKMSRATSSEVAHPCPPGKKFYPYQEAGIEYALNAMDRYGGALIADEMGLGKTLQAIGVMNTLPAVTKVLIACPASLKINWKREIAMWCTRVLPESADFQTIEFPWRVAILEGRKGPLPDAEILICNYDILQRIPDDYVPDLFVLDEIQYLINEKAGRTKIAMGIGKRTKRRLGLTGTPIVNRPKDLWALLQMIGPGEFDPGGRVKRIVSIPQADGSEVKKKKWITVGDGEGAGFFAYAQRFCAAKEEKHGWDEEKNEAITHWNFKGASNLDDLQEWLRGTIMVRRLKDDVLKDLPPKIRQVITFPAPVSKMGKEIARAKDEWFAEFTKDAIVLGKGDSERYVCAPTMDEFEDLVTEHVPLGEQAKQRKQDGIDKLPLVIDHVRTCLESSDKIILFGHHLEVLEALRSEFVGQGSVVITGETSQKERQAAVDRFQTDPTCRVIVLSIRAAGVGLTLTAAAHEIFAEYDWTPAAMDQAGARAHRIGQLRIVLEQYLVREGTIDAVITELLVKKKAVADAALDARKGDLQ